MKTTISIITPTYNRAHCIERAINSVKNLKKSEIYDYEHIVVDDGSTDDTILKIKKNLDSKLKCYQLKKNSGVNVARNYGIKKASGKYVLLLDSDDELMPDTLLKIESALNETKSKYMVYKFKTINNRTKKVMSFSESNLVLSYKEKLKGEKVSGEFISLINSKIFKTDLFDEDKFAFESSFWNRISKKFESEIYISDVLRVYHDDGEDRLCNQLLETKLAKKRTQDYENYLNEFKLDYLKFGLKSKLSGIYFRLGFYSLMSGDSKKSREYLKFSLKTKLNLKSIILYVASLFGSKICISLFNKTRKCL